MVEHFIEGPHKAISEAFRVLRPGGLAIITTPSVSWMLPFVKMRTFLKQLLKKIMFKNVVKQPFFQYEYRPRKLRNFVRESGLFVSSYGGCDLLFTFNQLKRFSPNSVDESSFAYRFSNAFENTIFSNLGAQSVTISIKLGEVMHCFFCGDFSANKQSLVKYEVPCCSSCNNKQYSDYYVRGLKPRYHYPYKINPQIKEVTQETCELCGTSFNSDILFEDFGFSKKVCKSCLNQPIQNIILSNTEIQPIWRSNKTL